MFDMVVSRQEPRFKDAAAVALRETLFETWQPEMVGFYLEALLRYAHIRQMLDSRHPTQGAHSKAKVEALNNLPSCTEVRKVSPILRKVGVIDFFLG